MSNTIFDGIIEYTNTNLKLIVDYINQNNSENIVPLKIDVKTLNEILDERKAASEAKRINEMSEEDKINAATEEAARAAAAEDLKEIRDRQKEWDVEEDKRRKDDEREEMEKAARIAAYQREKAALQESRSWMPWKRSGGTKRRNYKRKTTRRRRRR